MKNIDHYFSRKIMFSKLFGEGLSMPNKTNKEEWLSIIECDLSPENLRCDGEASASEVKAKLTVLTAAKNYVKQID